jgi:hypothetical protein
MTAEMTEGNITMRELATSGGQKTNLFSSCAPNSVRRAGSGCLPSPKKRRSSTRASKGPALMWQPLPLAVGTGIPNAAAFSRNSARTEPATHEGVGGLTEVEHRGSSSSSSNYL